MLGAVPSQRDTKERNKICGERNTILREVKISLSALPFNLNNSETPPQLLKLKKINKNIFEICKWSL